MANKSLTDLPLELLHQIFDHLDGRFLFCVIRCLSKQFYAALNTYDRYQLNSPRISVVAFWVIFNDIPFTNVVSLSLRNDINQPFCKPFPALNKICQCRRLYSLSLAEFDYDDVLETLRRCIGCPLVSLSIDTRQNVGNQVLIPMLSTIVQFNIQRLCFCVGKFNKDCISWLALCPIRVLKISTCSYTEYCDILHHFPHLRSLTIQYWSSSVPETTQKEHLSSKFLGCSPLTSLTITMYMYVGSDKDVEYLIALTPRLTHFKLISSQSSIDSLFDGFYWERIITENLPLLEKLEFFIDGQYQYPYSHVMCKLESFIDKFRGPFWRHVHRWFVTCDYVVETSEVRLYTTPICINDSDNLTLRAEISSINNTCRIVIPPKQNSIGGNDTEVYAEVCAGPLEMQFDVIEHIITRLQNERVDIIDGLSLNYVAIENNGERHLIYGLRQDLEFKNVYLFYNPFGNYGIQQLAHALKDYKTLITLDLFDSQIGDEGVEHIVTILLKKKMLTTLSLRQNQIGNDGARYLADALRHRSAKTLIGLHLAGNRLGDLAAQHLANALQENQTLCELDLSDNRISDEGVEYFANTLRTLTLFSLRQNPIGWNGVQQLAEVSRKNQTLRILWLPKVDMRETIVNRWLKKYSKVRFSGQLAFSDILRK